ncbi:MAG: zinc metalloprotease [Actinobacteria bacterium]|nr:zinc metalloprotease [Actinomycetota bacterium]
MPPRRKCGAMQVHERLAETYTSFRDNQDRIQRFTERSLTTGEAQAAVDRLVTIPVVVHVVYRTDEENISKSQINSQIAVLNRDFRANNPDKSQVPDVWKGLVADARIQFALATTAPNGTPTDGVTRTETNRQSFGTDDSVKNPKRGGAAAWPRDRYLNIWVCKLDEGYLGYAQFPGGPPRTDGVVILHSAFGTQGTASAPFNLGRTTTHEIGHWLNLRHIWADTIGCSGTDYIADTPNAQMPNYGTPTFPHISCNNGPNGDMFVNYMDYVDDVAMFMFSTGQAARMNACLIGARKKLAS